MRRIYPLPCRTPAAAILLLLLLTAGPGLAAVAMPKSVPGPAPAVAGSGSRQQDIRDIKGPIEIPSGRLPLVLAGCAGAFLLGGGILVYLRRRRRRRTTPPPSARELALARLSRIRPLMEKGESDEFAAGLAGILRSYIEARFHLSARNRTSREFIRTLAHDPAVPTLLRENRDRLQEWLHHFDMAKFACSPLTREQMQAMLEAVQDFIASTSPGETPDETPDSTAPTTPAAAAPEPEEVQR